MNKFLRFYNQNRKGIWLIIMIIAFVIFIIQSLNSFYANSEKQNNSQQVVASKEEKEKIEEKNESMVQGSIDSYEKKEAYTNLIERFLEYCSNNQPEEAYKLLSNDCKEKLYPTEKTFESEYYNSKFSQNKTYDFQLWSAIDKTYIYLVKIYDDMLSTGVVTTQKYIQDYYSVIQEDNVYRLSINNYIKNVSYPTDDEIIGDDGKDTQENNISVTVLNKDCYMDYEIYHISVRNNSEQSILLDTLLDENNLVVVDEKQNEFNAMLIELNEEDLVVEKQSSEFIDIKFSRNYTSGVDTEKMKFKKIVKNYEQYKQDKNTYQDFVEINVEFK